MRRRITLVILATVLLTLLLAGLGTVVLARLSARRSTESQVRDEVESVAALIDAVTGSAGLPVTGQEVATNLLCDKSALSSLTTATADMRSSRTAYCADANPTTLAAVDPAWCSTAPSQVTAGVTKGRVVAMYSLERLCNKIDPNRSFPAQKTLADEPITVVTIAPDGQVTGTLPAGVEPRFLDVEALRAGETVSGPVGSSTYAAAKAVGLSGNTTGPLEVVVSARQVELIGGALPWFLLSSALALVVAIIAGTLVSRRLVAPIREATAVTARIAGGDLTARLPEHLVSADEIDELAHSVNTMAGALEQSRGLERQFLLSVSHDLRTPLTSIRGYAEAITDGAIADPQEAAAIILSESRRLERLVTDLLELGMLDARQFTFHPRAVDLRDVAEDAVDGFRHGLAGQGLTVTFLGPPDPVAVQIDPDRLQQAVANLIENAARFARERVRVEVVGDGEWAHLSVIDDGPGIDPAALPMVFNRAWSGRGSSGLGLAIVRELVVAMGGVIEARNEPTGGARLLISLPSRP